MNNQITIIKSKDVEVKLLACDDMTIKVVFPDKSYTLADRNILHIKDMGFLMLCASEDTKLTFLLPLKLNEERLARDFLDYWGDKRLLELKNEKWESFLDFWRFTLSWIDFYVDVNFSNTTYQIYATDRRQYGGDLIIHLDVCIGDRFISEENSFKVYFDLNERLLDAYLNYYQDEDEYKWWSDIFVQFKPELDDISLYKL